MKGKTILTLAVILLISSINIFAENSSIVGNIKQIDSLTALPGVSVYLENTNYGTTTNGSGNYVMENIPEGNYIMVVSSIGYFTIKKEINVEKNETTKHNFLMTETIIMLSDITVTGGNVNIKDIPGSANYLSPKEIQKFGYTDVNRTLREIPGVNIQEEDGFGLFPNIGLRGTSVERSSKITVMEDEVLIAPAPYTAPAAYYFPTIGRMQGVEVLKGSSQIKYGPYTTGGAINMISTQIPNEFSGKITLMGGSYGGKNFHTVVGNSHKNFAYMVETYQYGSNGFKELDGAGNRGFNINSGFYKQDYAAKFQINTNTDAKIYQSLTFKIGQALGDINETYLGLTQQDFDANPIRRYAGSQVDNIQTKQRLLSLTHKVKFSQLFNITTIAYRTDFKRNWYKLNKVKDSTGAKTKISDILDNPLMYDDAYDIITGTTSTNADALFVKANNREYYSRGIQTKFNFTFLTNNISHDIDLGIRVHQDQIDRFQWVDEYAMDNYVMQLTKAGVHGTESNRVGTTNAIAAFLQYKLKIGNLTATPGIRYENINAMRNDYGKNDTERTGVNLKERSNRIDVFIPGIGLDYQFNSYVSTFAGIHKGFAPPGSKEDVKPEESFNYELGTRYTKKGLSGQAVLFYNDYSNLLGLDLEASGGGGTNEKFNGGAVKTKGFEFNVTYDLLFSKRLSPFSLPLTIVYTYSDSKFQNTFKSTFGGWKSVTAGDQLPYLANNQFTIMLGLEHHKFSLNLSGKFMDEMRTAPGQGEIPANEKIDSYFVVDASANYNLNKNVSLFVNAANLLNKTYLVARWPAGLRPGMPIAFNFGVKAIF